jgi:hypothetical protein
MASATTTAPRPSSGGNGMRIARIVGFVLLAVSAVYFVVAAWKYASELPPIAWNAATAAVIGWVTLAYLVQFLTAGMGWHLWLSAVGEPSRPMVAITLFTLSQFAKYVPGSIAQHIARVALGKRHGFGMQGMVVTLGLETAWALVAGIAVAAVCLALAKPALLDGATLPSLLRIAAVAVIALLVPSAAIWLMGSRRPAFLDRWFGPNRIAHPRLGTLALCFVLYCANFLICGWILNLLARQIFGAPEDQLLISTGVFAVAWVIGFVTLISPGGLGVREAVLLAGLTPAYGAGTALGIAILYRLVTSLGDGIGFIAGFIAEKRLTADAAGSSRKPSPQD